MSAPSFAPQAQSRPRTTARQHATNAITCLLTGLLVIAFGAALTFLFSRGSTVVVTVGAFVFGVVQIARGLFYLAASLFALFSPGH